MNLSSCSPEKKLVLHKYKDCNRAFIGIDTHFFLYIYGMNFWKKELQPVVKTLIDYSVTIVCLIILAPVIVVLAVIIKLTGKGPVIYSQDRIGESGKPFRIYKFRSMYHGTEEGIPLLSGKDDRRISPVGRFMRKHKFDEIPNFFNVLKGEMSIVGPRPEQSFFIEKIVAKAPEYRRLQTIKPGITSWGQVKYGYATNVEEMVERLKYDIYYLENRSLLFDLKIAFHTLWIIMKGQGV
jgi:lipopolysaccharide/colanic/teichoic acid biosynthesis glycosyltransferase